MKSIDSRLVKLAELRVQCLGFGTANTNARRAQRLVLKPICWRQD